MKYLIFLIVLVVGFTAVPVRARPPSEVGARVSLSALWAQLNALPRHKTPFSKVWMLVDELTGRDARRASRYLTVGLMRMAELNANQNAKDLTHLVNRNVVRSRGQLTAEQKRRIIIVNDKLLKSYVPPHPGCGCF